MYIFRSIIGLLFLLTSSYAQDDGGASSSFIEKALATGNFNLLGAVLENFGDIPALLASLGGQVTIFGPTDEAFAAAGISNASALDQPTLFNHGTIGAFDAATLSAKSCSEYPNLAGGKIVVEVSNGTILVNGVTVNSTFADIQGNDGIFHGVNGVVGPATSSCTPSTVKPTKAPNATDAPKATPATPPDSAGSQMKPLLAVASIFVSCVLFL